MSRLVATAAVAAASALALAGCAGSSPAETQTPGPTAASGLLVVASTDVYADIAQQIGGDLITTQAIISGTGADPHSYEATARDQLAIADADLLILNGAGYDDFMTTLIDASGNDATVISAVDASGLVPGGGEAPDGVNEHVWYSLPAMSNLADAIEHELAGLDPANAAAFAANTTAFQGKLDALKDRAATIAATAKGAQVLVTEPVPLYLLESAGAVNITPDAFMEAVEEGTDIPVSLLDEVITLATSGTVRMLAYNEQTTGPETERVRKAAKGAGVAVVSFSETLPAGQDYLSWMSENLDAIATAIA